MNLNQLTIIGFVGKNAETKRLENGTSVVKFSVATKKSWKDANEEWKNKTQWHNVIGFGAGFAQMTERLVQGAHVFVQSELSTREYDRVIQVPNGKKAIEHSVRQLVVELRADTIRVLDCSSSGEQSDAAELRQTSTSPNRDLLFFHAEAETASAALLRIAGCPLSNWVA